MRISLKGFLRLKERNVLESRFIRDGRRGQLSRRPFVASGGGRSAQLTSDVEDAHFRSPKTRWEARDRFRSKIYVAEEHVRPEARKLRQPLPLSEGNVERSRDGADIYGQKTIGEAEGRSLGTARL